MRELGSPSAGAPGVGRLNPLRRAADRKATKGKPFMQEPSGENRPIGGVDQAAQVVDRLLLAASEELGAERVSAWLFDRDLRSIYPYVSRASRRAPGSAPTETWNGVPAESIGLVGQLLGGAPFVVIDEASGDTRLPRALTEDFGIDSLYATLVSEIRPLAVLIVEPASAAMDAGDASLKRMTGSLATPCELMQACQEADRDRSEAEFLLDLMTLARPGRSVTDVLKMVCTRLSREVEVERACVFLLSEGRLVPRMAQFADGRRDPGAWRRFVAATENFPLTEEVLRTGSPVIAEQYSPALIGRWWADTFGIESSFAVPIGERGQMKGVLTLDSSVPQRFSVTQVRLAEAVGRRLGDMLERAQQVEDQLSHLRSAEAVLQVLEEGSSASSVDEAAGILADVARSALRTDHAVAYLGNDGTVISHVIGSGLDGKSAAFLRRSLIGRRSRDFGIWRRTLEETEPIFVEEAASTDLIPADLVTVLDLGSYTSIPLLTREGPLGLVICSNHGRTHRWALRERLLARRLMLEGSLIIDNARLRAAEQLRVAELSHQAYHDYLTGLPNRALLFDRLGQLQAMSRRESISVGLLLIDLDLFKEVNDTLGHLAGDFLLKQFASKLRGLVRQSDTVARFGGDEFAVLLPRVDRAGAMIVAEKICEAAATPVEVEGTRLSLGASVGVAMYPEDAEDVDKLIRAADMAMYGAKRSRNDGLSAL